MVGTRRDTVKRDSFQAERAVKWRAPPEHPETTSGNIRRSPPFVKSNERDRDPAATSQARRCAPEPRQARVGRARGLHRARHFGAARGRGRAGGRRDRDPLPALPDPPGAPRGGLRRRGRGDGAGGGGPVRAAALGCIVALAAPVRRVRGDQARAERGAGRGGSGFERPARLSHRDRRRRHGTRRTRTARRRRPHRYGLHGHRADGRRDRDVPDDGSRAEGTVARPRARRTSLPPARLVSPCRSRCDRPYPRNAAGLATVAFAGTGGLWLLYLLAAGTGVALVFDNPSKHALIYQLVGRAELPNAVSLNVSLQNAAKVVGPALGGVLIAVVGSGWCFAVNAASFLAVLAALLAMRPAELFPVERGERQSGIRALREGVAYVRGSRLLRAILAVGAVLGLFGFRSLRTLLSVLAGETLHGGPRTFGGLFAAYGAGAVCGALASAALSRTGRRLLIGGAFLFSAPILALAPVRVTAVAAALLFVAGVGWATWSGQAFAQVQLAAPDRLRGRVISLYTYTLRASAPLGGLLGGWLADVGGTELAFAVSGGAGVAAAATGAAVLHGRRVPARHVAADAALPDEVPSLMGSKSTKSVDIRH